MSRQPLYSSRCSPAKSWELNRHCGNKNTGTIDNSNFQAQEQK